MNRTSSLCGNCNGHHNTKNIKTHYRTTQKTKKMSNMDPTNKLWVNSCFLSKIDIFYWSAKHTALRNKSKDRLGSTQDKVFLSFLRDITLEW
jgi:hypothetical protein